MKYVLILLMIMLAGCYSGLPSDMNISCASGYGPSLSVVLYSDGTKQYQANCEKLP